MKVYILAHGHSPFQSGYLIFKEAMYQKKTVEIGYLEWEFDVILSAVKRAKPDWIFVTGSRALQPDQLIQLKEYGKLAIWDADAVNSDEKDKIWQSLVGIPDVVFSTLSGLAKRYPGLSDNTVYLPQFYDHRTFAPEATREEVEQPYDVVFLGGLDEKIVGWLERLLAQDIKVVFGNNIHGQQMANTYLSSKIAFGRWVGEYPTGEAFMTSNRIYNALGCGCFYLLHPVGNLNSMFKNRVHLDSYDGSYEDLERQIKYYLQHDEIREKVAMRGHYEVMMRHTLEVRLKQYWKILSEAM